MTVTSFDPSGDLIIERRFGHAIALGSMSEQMVHHFPRRLKLDNLGGE